MPLTALAFDEFLEIGQLDKNIGLAAYFIGNHRRFGNNRADYRHPPTFALNRLDQPTKIAIAGKDHDMIQMWLDFHYIHGQLDMNIAFDLLAACGVSKFLGGFGHHGVAVVVQPIDQRPDRGTLLFFHHGGVIKGAD